MSHRAIFVAQSTFVRALSALLAVVIAVAGLSLTASSAAAESSPTITSDKADYAPGELVTLTGAGWQPGESVHLTIDDEIGRSWQRQVDVTADEQGQVVDRFNLPDWFVASYTVVAEGAASGRATHWFTDGNIKVYARTPAGQTITAQVLYSVTSNVSACPTAAPTNTIAADDNGETIAGGANAADRVKLVAPSTVTSANGTHTFSNWTIDGAAAGTSLTLCAPGNNTGTVDIIANYTNGAASNAAPTANTTSTTVAEDGNVSVTLNGSDTNTGDTLSFTVLAGPANGSLGTIGAPACSILSGVKQCTAQVTYTPTANFNGGDSFTYRVSDGTTTATGTRNLTVTPVNDAPSATSQSVAVTKGSAKSITLAGTDLETPGALTFTVVPGEGPSHGSLSGNAPNLTYTPAAGYTGPDSFKFTVTDAGDGTAAALTSAQATVTIDVAAADTQTTVDPQSTTYGAGTVGLTATVTRTGGSVNSGAVTFTLRDSADQVVGSAVTDSTVVDGAASATYTLPAGTSAGDYTIRASYDGTVLGNSSGSNTLTIDQRPVTVTADPQTKTYGNSDPALTYEITAGSLAYSDDFTGALTRDPGQAVGSYDILPGTLSLGANYDLSFIGDELTITRRLVTVTADDRSKTYGEADPALTYEITAGSLAYDDGFEGALDREAGQAVGTYDITQGNLRLSDNYELTFVGAELTIGARELTITATNQTKTFGETKDLGSTAFSVGDDQLVAGDSVSSVTLNSPGAAASASVAGGPYPITPSGALGTGLDNYDINYVAGSLFVDRAVLTVTPAAKTKTYGDEFPASDFTGSITGEQGSDAFTATYSSPGSDSGVDVGQYDISVDQVTPLGDTDLDNYTVSKETATLFVDPAVLTVTPAAKTKTYGDPFTAFTGTITGQKNSDKFAATYKSLGSPATADVDDYVIEVDTLSEVDGSKLSNYVVSTETATLFVDPAVLTVTPAAKTKTYGDAFPASDFTGTITGQKNTDAFTATYSSPGSDAGADAGQYDIAVDQVTPLGDTDLDNYTVSKETATLFVDPAVLTVTPAAKTKTYGDAFSDFTGTITGQKNSDEFAATYKSLGSPATADVDDYVIEVDTLSEVDGSKLSNYVVSTETATLFVDPAVLTVTPATKTKTYGDTFSAFTGSITGERNDDEFTATYSSPGSTATAAAGEHVISVSTVSPGNAGSKLSNYVVSKETATLFVDLRALTVTATDQAKTYGEAKDLGSTAFTTGAGQLVNGDTVTAVTLNSPGAASSAPVSGAPYDITASGATGNGLGNYAISYVTGKLAVSSKAVTVTAVDKFKYVGAADPTLTHTVTGLVGDDTLQGVSCTVPAAHTAGGIYAITCSGNTNTNYAATYVPGKLTVGFRWNGFLQPINDTAHQTGVQTSKFKLGQTIPAKFQIRDVNNVVVTQAVAPTFKATRVGGCVGDTVSEDIGTVAVTSGSSYTWDGNQYHFNWSTKGLEAGLWRVRAVLADGNTQAYVDICLSR